MADSSLSHTAGYEGHLGIFPAIFVLKMKISNHDQGEQKQGAGVFFLTLTSGFCAKT